MSKKPIATSKAPAAIGPYSQAVRAGDTVYVSGQIPLDPETGAVIDGDFAAMTDRVFDNLAAIAEAAGGTLDDVVKLNVFLTDLLHFATVNEMMAERFTEPYPARAAVQVAALPKGVPVEMEAIMIVGAS
jgi:reactive intermediate/imine deaminase